jgi:hypothetical protein
VTWLTSPRFADPAERPEAAGQYPAVGLFLDPAGGVAGVYAGRNGTHRLGVSGMLPFTVALAHPDTTDRLPFKPTAWAAGVTAVHDAAEALARQDWAKFGAALDRAYAAEREGLPPDAARDAAYAAGRTAGALGGRCGEGLVLFVVPADKLEAVRAAAAKHAKGAS